MKERIVCGVLFVTRSFLSVGGYSKVRQAISGDELQSHQQLHQACREKNSSKKEVYTAKFLQDLEA